MAYHPPTPECPHCGGQDTELQMSGRTKEIYLCNGCARTFEIPTEKGVDRRK